MRAAYSKEPAMMGGLYLIGLLLFAFCSFSVGRQLYEGDECAVKSTNLKGVCKLIDDCPSVKDDIRKKIYPTHCGFSSNKIVVCCPKAPDLKVRQPGQISDEMCRNYSQYVWTVELSPTLIIGAEVIKRKECPFDRLQLVVGGEPASRKEIPHMTQLGYGDDPIKWGCGGSLISDQYVLTAGHCLDDRFLGEVLHVRMGLTDIDDPEHVQQFKITERIAHPDYDPPSAYHDIGLVKLDKKASLNSYVRPACLYKDKESPWSNVIATGWGKTEFAGFESTVLLRVVLELYNDTYCNTVYKHDAGSSRLQSGIKNDLMVCAGHSEKLRDTCQGDSGGPLQVYRRDDKNSTCMYDVIGVTSFGKACGLAVNIPGVYTRVSNYIKWIEDHVWPLN